MREQRIQPDLLDEDDFPVEFGRYTLLGLLGEGGMARVFSAELQGPSGFRKAAAVKIIRGSVAAKSEALRTSLINEARLGGLLHHPNVVDTYDYGEVDGLPYIAMEMIRGVGLEKILSIVHPLPLPIALEVSIQICAGLDHAHTLEDAAIESELVHRDLKPSNVIVSRDGLVKVMDFGIAKATSISEGNTETGMTKGTPAYMSPEQVGGEDLDPRSDLFAMGSIIYELTTGKRLFGGDSIMSVLMGVIQVEERLSRQDTWDELEGLVPGLATVIQTCLKKDREERYASAAVLEEELKRLSRALPPPPSMKLWVRELMKKEGIAGGSSSSSNISAQRAARPRDISQPSQPAAAVPPTVPQTPAVLPTAGAGLAVDSPVGAPMPPPRVPPSEHAVPATRLQQASLAQMQAPRAVRKPGGKAPLLLLLGLFLGLGLAAVAVFFLVSGGDAPVEPVVRPEPSAMPDLLPEPEPEPTAVAAVTEPEPEPAEPATRPPPKPRPEPIVIPRPKPTGDAEADAAALAAAEAAEAEAAEKLAEEAAAQQAAELAAAKEAAELRARRDAAAKARAEREAERVRRREAAAAKAKNDVPDPNGKSDVPAPTKGGSGFAVAGVSAKKVSEEGDVIKMRFTARMNGGREPKVMLHFDPTGGSWLEREMRSKDGELFSVTVSFQKRNHGRCYYYVTADAGDGSRKRDSWGSSKRALTTQVK